MIIYDAARCPYCARIRILLAEKGLGYEAATIDLDDRPAWLYEKNPRGKVPVLEEDDGLVLPESLVIMEYIEERFPEPALWPADPAERALGRLWLDRFDDRLGDAYYALRRGDGPEQLDAKLAELDRALEAQPYLTGRDYGLADIGYAPWLLRARDMLDVDLERFTSLSDWLERLAARPAIAAARELVLAQDAEELATAVAAMRDRPDSTELVGETDAPVLVARGEHDPFLSADEAEAIARSARAGRTHPFAGSGHLPSLEQPEEFDRVVEEFLAHV